jgi:fatty-acyl-CoA synthase
MSSVRTLPEALADAAESPAGYTFVGSGTERRRSYAEIHATSLRVASALRARGLKRQDLVALIIGDADQFLTTLFGASIAGVIPASLYPPATTSDLQRYLTATAGILNSCGARAVVTTAALHPHIDSLRTLCPTLGCVLPYEALDAAGDGPHSGFPAISADDVAFVQFTSGSTSAPKGVIVTHRNLSANIQAFSGAAGVSSSLADVAVSWLPMYHDMGLVGMAIGSLYTPNSAAFLTPQAFVKRPVDWLRAVSRYHGTISFAPNFAYDLAVRRVKEADLAGLDLSSWRVAGCGSEPIHAPTLAAFAEKFGAVGFSASSFLPSYGLAEHVLAASFCPRGRQPIVEHLSADDATSRRVATRATKLSEKDRDTLTVVSCGRPLPGHQIRIADELGRPLPERCIGEITLAGPSVTPGYYRNEALTDKMIRNGFLHTGDLGYLSDGELFVCGRMKDVIIVNGRKHHAQDLEWSIDDLAGIRRGRVAAFGTAEQGRPERAVIVVEPSGTVPAAELTDAIRRRIVDLCGLLIHDVVLAPHGTVSRTTSGKVRRAATKQRYERGDLEMAAGGQTGLHA